MSVALPRTMGLLVSDDNDLAWEVRGEESG